MLEIAYGVSSTLMVVFYIPQLLKVIRAKPGESDTSLLTWGMWSVCMSINAIYAIEVINDDLLIAYSVASVAACVLIFAVAMWKQMIPVNG